MMASSSSIPDVNLDVAITNNGSILEQAFIDAVGTSYPQQPEEEINDEAGCSFEVIPAPALQVPAAVDTVLLSKRVRNYLDSNQIQWNRFSSLVLGVGQSRLSTLIGHPKPWNTLSRRVQALYERMQLWMDTRATYGNNPYMRTSASKLSKKNRLGSSGSKKKAAPRSLFEMDNNRQMIEQLEQNLAKNKDVFGDINNVRVLEIKEETKQNLALNEEFVFGGINNVRDPEIKEETNSFNNHISHEEMMRAIINVDINENMSIQVGETTFQNWNDLLNQVEDANASKVLVESMESANVGDVVINEWDHAIM